MLKKWLTGWVTRSQSISMTDELAAKQWWEMMGRGREASSGVVVNEQTVWGLPGFTRGVDLIADTVARVRGHVYERIENDARRRAMEHSAYRIVRRRANPYMSTFDWLRQMVSDMKWAGNGYSVIQRNNDYSPAATWLLDCRVTFPVFFYADDGSFTLKYQTTINNATRFYDASDIIHFKNRSVDPSGMVGLSLVEQCKESLGLGLAVQKYGAVWFKRGGLGVTAIELPVDFKNQKDLNEYRNYVEGVHYGVDNQHKFFLVPFGGKLNRSPVTNEEAQFLQSREASKIDCATMLGLPAYKLNSSISTSHNSIEAQSLDTLTDCYEPILCQIEAELENKLLTEQEKESGSHYIEFERDDLRILDATTQTNVDIAKVNNGLMSEEQYFRKYNLPTKKDPNETWRLPANILIQGEEPKVQPEAPQAPVEAPQEQPEQPTEDQPQQESGEQP